MTSCRMLLEPSSELNKLPQLWLNFMLDHIRRPDQSRDDIVRRSAGIPCAFVALFAGEPTGNPKITLQRGTPCISKTILQSGVPCISESTCVPLSCMFHAFPGEQFPDVRCAMMYMHCVVMPVKLSNIERYQDLALQPSGVYCEWHGLCCQRLQKSCAITS